MTRRLKLNLNAPWAKQDWAQIVRKDLEAMLRDKKRREREVRGELKRAATEFMPRLIALKDPEPHELAPVGPAKFDWKLDRVEMQPGFFRVGGTDD